MNPRSLAGVPAGLALLLASSWAGAAGQAAVREVRDDTGERVTLPAKGCRIISLAPGTTAMLYAVGGGPCLVGTIAHSDEPTDAAKLPIVGDAETFDFERMLALRPTVVVIAVDVVQRARIDRIRSLGIPIYQVHVTSLAGMPASVRRLGALTRTEQVADREAEELAAELGRIEARYRARPPIRVLYQIWDRPIYTISGSHVITDALKLCGAVNIFGDLAAPAAPAVTREAALLRDPQLILASAPPGAADEWLAEWRKFPTIAAVKSGQLVGYTDERIDRMGPSVIAATANLCEVVDRARASIGAASAN